MRELRDDLLGLWIAEDATKTLLVSRDATGETRVTVWRGLGEEVLASERPACFRAPAVGAERSASALARLGVLSVELGEVGAGTTYDLMFAAERGPNDPADFAWRAVRATDVRDRVRVFPQGGASFLEAVLGAWDEAVEAEREREQAWLEPLSTYRPATTDEAAEHARRITVRRG